MQNNKRMDNYNCRGFKKEEYYKNYYYNQDHYMNNNNNNLYNKYNSYDEEYTYNKSSNKKNLLFNYYNKESIGHKKKKGSFVKLQYANNRIPSNNTKLNNMRDKINYNKMDYDYILTKKKKKRTSIEKNNKHNDMIGDVYYKIAYYLKKNRKYMQRILEKNYVIKIYLVRHMEALHNTEVIKNSTISRDMIYRNKDFFDCPASEEGKIKCEQLKSKDNKLYQKLIKLYNESVHGKDEHTGDINMNHQKYNSKNKNNNNNNNNHSNSNHNNDNHNSYSNSLHHNHNTSNNNNILHNNQSYSNSLHNNQSYSNLRINEHAKGAFEKNNNFVIITSPLRRCLETTKYFLNFKKNIIVYEAVRETAGNYYSDQRSKTSDIKKFCDQNFEDYELICFGETDSLSGNKYRETSEQVYCRCLQFLKLIHALAINYFASLEKINEQEEINNKNFENMNSQTCTNDIVENVENEKLCSASQNDNSFENKGNKVINNLNNSGKVNEKKKKKAEMKDDNEKKEFDENNIKEEEKEEEDDDFIVENNKDVDDGKMNDEMVKKRKNKKDVYNVVMVSHSSFIVHMLALLDYLDLDFRGLNNCDIRKISIPLSHSFLFYNNITNLQIARPLSINNIPISYMNKNKALKKAYKDKYIYTINSYTELDELICSQPCTVIIYQYDMLIKNEKNKKYLDSVQKFIDNSNNYYSRNSNKEKHVYSNGLYKNYVLRNKSLGRSVLIYDGSEYLIYVPEKGSWEINKKGYIVGQNIILVVLPEVESKIINKENVGEEEYVSLNTKNKEQNENYKKTSHYLQNVIDVIKNYDSIQDLIKSIDFWITLKENIKNIDIPTFQKYLIEKYNKIIKNEMDVCYVDIVGCIENEEFMKKNEHKCNGYLKSLKEKYEKNNDINFEEECKYINENFIEEIFTSDYSLPNVDIKNEKDISSHNKNKNNDNNNNNNNDFHNNNIHNNNSYIQNNDFLEENIIRKKFIYIPKKDSNNIKIQSNIKQTYKDEKQNKSFLQENINVLKSFPQSIQNLSVEMFYRDNYFYFHCLNKYIKSKNKIEGLIICKLLTYLDLLRSYNTHGLNKTFQRLINIEEKIDNNTKGIGETLNTYSLDINPVHANNTSYYGEGPKKYKIIFSIPGRKKSVVDDLNFLRYNILTVAGGAENVYILNVLK
ncbi:phosphoglycerate mutase, putative [Plasmodium reichenowi]|uniref:Phosphoglycerate mutase, putative n=1 Tax=Plasmodium reichenowi TaxID=5854 RepID=A0A060RSJ7_PLARE|nr:phosphoglycerate mutase, putative [Plasmodium reichenowi]